MPYIPLASQHTCRDTCHCIWQLHSHIASTQATLAYEQGESTDALLLRWNQISSLLVPELHLVAQHVDVQQFPHVFLAVILCRNGWLCQHVSGGYRTAGFTMRSSVVLECHL